MDGSRVGLFQVVAMKCINNSCDVSISQDLKQSALGILMSRLGGYISAEQAARQCQSVIGTYKPAEWINEILAISAYPVGYYHPVPRVENLPTSPLSTRSKARSWTPYEDQRLLAGVWRFGVNNWPMVARFVGNRRTRGQCAQRWNRGLNPTIDKGPWTETEEERLLSLVTEHGDKSWTRIAALMGHRSDVQCRYRYQQLKKKRQIGALSPTADDADQLDLGKEIWSDLWLDGDGCEQPVVY